MTDAFAIAAVTATLRELLTERLVPLRNNGFLDAGFDLSTRAPDLIPTDQNAVSRLNLFLYDVAPNTGYANERLASRDADGDVITRPALALDLLYLLSAFGRDDLEAEIILGHAMQVLHETPGLSRAAIQRLLDPNAAGLSNEVKRFRQRAITLADQVEQVKISPRYLKAEEMSKIWTSLQAHYRPSVVYHASLVLIESSGAARGAPPVLTRGPLDGGPVARPNLLPVLPTLLAALPPDRNPAVRVSDTLKLFGANLRGANVEVRFEHSRLDRVVTVSGTGGANPPLVIRALDPDGADKPEARSLPAFADTCIEVNLSKAVPANTWAAGVHRVEVRVQRPGESSPRTSNALAAALAPVPSVAAGDVTKPGGSRLRVAVGCNPRLRAGQTAVLLLGSEQFPPVTPAADTAKPVFESVVPAELLAAGSQHLLRFRVDGVESVFIKRDPLDDRKPPEFDPAQQVTVP